MISRNILWRRFLKRAWISDLVVRKISIFKFLLKFNKIKIFQKLKKKYILKYFFSKYLILKRYQYICKYYKNYIFRRSIFRNILCKLVIWPFFSRIANIWSFRLNKISFFKTYIYFIGLTNYSITAQILARYFAVKLRSGYKLLNVLAPVKKDLLFFSKNKSLNGFKFLFKGRFQRRHRSKRFSFTEGNISLNNLSTFIDYSRVLVVLRNSAVSVHVWLCRDFRFHQKMGYLSSNIIINENSS